jgi:hypothetical protein
VLFLRRGATIPFVEADTTPSPPQIQHRMARTLLYPGLCVHQATSHVCSKLRAWWPRREGRWWSPPVDSSCGHNVVGLLLTSKPWGGYSIGNRSGRGIPSIRIENNL